MSVPKVQELEDVWEDNAASRHLDSGWDTWGLGVSRLLPRHARGHFLEWGYGGGAIHRALRDLCATGSYTAVDVSPSARDLARKSRARALPPEETKCIATASIDVIISAAVFQHFPSQEYGVRVLEEMARVARPGVIGMIQTRYYIPGERHDPSLRKGSYKEHFLTACAWQVHDFWRALQSVGFVPESVELDTVAPNNHYAFYRFRK